MGLCIHVDSKHNIVHVPGYSPELSLARNLRRAVLCCKPRLEPGTCLCHKSSSSGHSQWLFPAANTSLSVKNILKVTDLQVCNAAITSPRAGISAK